MALMSIKKRLSTLHLIALFGLFQPSLTFAGHLRCIDLFPEAAEAQFLSNLQSKLSQFETEFGVPLEPVELSYGSLFNLKKFERIGRIDSGSNHIDLWPFGVNSADPGVIVPAIDSKFPYTGLIGENWKWTDDHAQTLQYRLINIGTGQLKADWSQIEKSVDQVVKKNPLRHLIIKLSQKMMDGLQILNAWKMHASQKATETYSERKNYLDRDSLFSLRHDDSSSEKNDDYLVLMKDPQIPTLDVSPELFEKNALAIVRLARLGAHSSNFPESWLPLGQGNLPVTDRFRDTTIGTMLKISFSRLHHLAGKRIAEISRFVRFQDFPSPIMSSFLKKLFEIAQDPKDPIDILVISVDSKTRRLFGPKYHFKDLAIIREENGRPQEYLMYLDTHSDDFQKTLAELRQESGPVKISQAPAILAENNKFGSWKPRAGWIEGSPEEKEQRSNGEISHLRSEVKRLPISHLSWNIEGVSDEPLRNPERARQLMEWVWSGKELPEPISKKLQLLTEAENQILFKNVFLFTNIFSKGMESISRLLPTQGKILLVYDGLEPIQKVLQPQYPDREIHLIQRDEFLSSSLQQYDIVLVVSGHSDHKISEIEKENMLNASQVRLVKGGKYFLFYRRKNNWLKDSQYYFLDLIKNLLQNGAPCSEKEFVLEMARLRLVSEQPDQDLQFERGFGAGGSNEPDWYINTYLTVQNQPKIPK